MLGRTNYQEPLSLYKIVVYVVRELSISPTKTHRAHGMSDFRMSGPHEPADRVRTEAFIARLALGLWPSRTGRFTVGTGRRWFQFIHGRILIRFSEIVHTMHYACMLLFSFGCKTTVASRAERGGCLKPSFSRLFLSTSTLPCW